MISTVAEHILNLPPWVALLLVFALPALESSAFVGFVFPGEIALLLGGVIASQGRLSLTAVLVVGIAGAVAGDSVGYAVGRRYGRRLLDGSIGRFIKRDHLDRAERYLAERGGKAVFFGRFTAALRVMIPGLAGMSGLRYRTFLIFNVAGGVGWVVLSVLLGYFGGSSWKQVEHIASRIGLGVLGAMAVAVAAGFVFRRLGARRPAWLTTPRITLGMAVVALVAGTWTFAGVTQDVVAHEELALLDPDIETWVLGHRTGWLNAFFHAFTWLGHSAVVVPALAFIGVLLARRRRSWGPLVDLAVTYLAVVLLDALAAELVQRVPPAAAGRLVSTAGWTYPSSHTAQGFAAWGAVAVLVSAGASRRLRLLVCATAGTVALLIAASRVYLGVSWATDVFAGVAMASAVLGAWWLTRQLWFSTTSAASESKAETMSADSEHTTLA